MAKLAEVTGKLHNPYTEAHRLAIRQRHRDERLWTAYVQEWNTANLQSIAEKIAEIVRSEGADPQMVIARPVAYDNHVHIDVSSPDDTHLAIARVKARRRFGLWERPPALQATIDGKRISIISGAVVGRAPAPGGIITPPGNTAISREHAQFDYREGSWWLTDMSSSGTRVEGSLLQRHTCVPVRQGSIIILGARADAAHHITIRIC